MQPPRPTAYTKAAKKRLLRRAGYACQACGGGTVGGSRHAARLEIHHYTPRSSGGLTAAENAVVLCLSCHVRVHAGTLTCPTPTGAEGRGR